MNAPAIARSIRLAARSAAARKAARSRKRMLLARVSYETSFAAPPPARRKLACLSGVGRFLFRFGAALFAAVQRVSLSRDWLAAPNPSPSRAATARMTRSPSPRAPAEVPYCAE